MTTSEEPDTSLDAFSTTQRAATIERVILRYKCRQCDQLYTYESAHLDELFRRMHGKPITKEDVEKFAYSVEGGKIPQTTTHSCPPTPPLFKSANRIGIGDFAGAIIRNELDEWTSQEDAMNIVLGS